VDQTYLLALVVAILVLMVALARMTTRRKPTAEEGAGDSPIAVSTEGMTMCAACGMGNLWTERHCSSCGADLKG
jgi:hypothetical protein